MQAWQKHWVLSRRLLLESGWLRKKIPTQIFGNFFDGAEILRRGFPFKICSYSRCCLVTKNMAPNHCNFNIFSGKGSYKEKHQKSAAEDLNTTHLSEILKIKSDLKIIFHTKLMGHSDDLTYLTHLFWMNEKQKMILKTWFFLWSYLTTSISAKKKQNGCIKNCTKVFDAHIGIFWP